MNILIPRLPDKYLPKRPSFYEDESSNESSNERKPTSFFKQLRKREERGTPIWAFTNNIFLSCNDNNEIIFTRVFAKNIILEKLIKKLNKTKKNIFMLTFRDNQLFYQEYINFSIKYTSLNYIGKEHSTITEIEHLHDKFIMGIYLKFNNIINTHNSVLSSDIDFPDFLFCDKNGNYFYIKYTTTDDFFKIFKNQYGKQLKLELYKDFYIQSLEDVERFKREFAFRLEHSAYYPQPLTTGGKKILKTYRS